MAALARDRLEQGSADAHVVVLDGLFESEFGNLCVFRQSDLLWTIMEVHLDGEDKRSTSALRLVLH